MAPASLISMPLEVLIEITSYLDTPSFCAARRTCRGIEAALFRTFAQKYFRKIGLMRTDFSLQVLVDISKSRFSSYLQHVVISTRLLSPKRGLRIRMPPLNERDKSLLKFNQLCSDQLVLLETSHDREMLTEAFRNLNLQVIEVSEHAPTLFPSRTPVTYGMSYILRETGVDVKLDDISSHSTHRRSNMGCVQNVLYALGQSGSRPKQFEIETYHTRFDDDVLNIPTFMSRIVSPVLSGLEVINIRAGSRSMASIPSGLVELPDKLDTYHLRRFLSQTTQVKHLCLDQVRHWDGFYRWFTAEFLHDKCGGFLGFEPAQVPKFTQLQELELGWFEVNIDEIGTILEKNSKTLRKLTLHDMTFWLPDPFKDEFDEWPELMTSLAHSARHLQEVHFSKITVAVGRESRVIDFGNGTGTDSFSYAGPNMEKVLARMVHMLPEEDPREYIDGDGDDDDDDDESEIYPSDEDDLADFDEYMDYVDEYDDLIDGIDEGLAEDLMFQTIFGV